MSAKHTPGPWRAICDSPGTLKIARMAMVATNGGRTSMDCTGSGKDYAEDCANAQLIAQAPALLHWLSSPVRDLPTNRDWLDPDIEREARAAIAAATGDAG